VAVPQDVHLLGDVLWGSTHNFPKVEDGDVFAITELGC
jgi:hypothetical protein